ncbi:MAG: hypothetical protein ACE5OY_06595 [Candidatus Bathyarchaeia archaeon]
MGGGALRSPSPSIIEEILLILDRRATLLEVVNRMTSLSPLSARTYIDFLLSRGLIEIKHDLPGDSVYGTTTRGREFLRDRARAKLHLSAH